LVDKRQTYSGSLEGRKEGKKCRRWSREDVNEKRRGRRRREKRCRYSVGTGKSMEAAVRGRLLYYYSNGGRQLTKETGQRKMAVAPHGEHAIEKI
jgi:hypothetical protein